MTKKKVFRKILTVAVMLAVMIFAIAILGALDVSADEAQTPSIDSSQEQIFGNGTHIYVVEGTSGGTAVYYMSGSTKVYVNPNGATGDDLSGYSIYGGFKNTIFDGDTYITMTGGKVMNIIGAGTAASTTDLTLGQVNSVYIKITGGTVTNRVAASLAAGVKGNVSIEITGGTVPDVYGAVARSSSGATWRRVYGNSTITITGNTTVTGEVHCGDGYNPVNGTQTLVTTVPITFKLHGPASVETYLDNFLYKDGSTWKVKGSVTVPAGATFTIADGETLSVPAGATLTNNGTIVNNGNLDIVGTVRNNGSISCSNHTYTYSCDTTCNLCGSTRSVSCEAKTGSVSGSTITVPCKYCGSTIGTVTINSSTVKYNGSGRSLAVSLTGIYAGTTQTVSYTKSGDSSFSGTPVYPGTYTGSVTVAGVTASATLTVEKADLSVATAPSVTYYYGEDAQSKSITGKVVAATNSSLTVSGTWAWSGSQAVFTPDSSVADYFNSLPAQTVVHNVQAATPVIVIESPSPAIMPGMSIVFDMTVTNPYTSTPASLPTTYCYVYKIGQNGTLEYSYEEKFTVPSDVSVGETVYVYVGSFAESGKYEIGISNTVELFIGQIDYTEQITQVQTNLDNAIAALNQADTDNAKELAEAIEDLEGAIAAAQAAAEQAAADGDDALGAALTKKIDEADAALDKKISDLGDALDEAVKELKQADKDNADALAQAIVDLTATIEVAQAAAEAYADAGDEALGAALTKKIDEADAALDKKISDLGDALDEAVKELKQADKDNAEALAQAIVELTATIEAAQAAAEAYADAGDDALGAALTKKIDEADAILQENIEKVQENLDTQVERLDQVDAENAEALRQAIEDLMSAIRASQAIAKSAAKLGDAELKAALTEKIDAADKALAQAIEDVQNNLDAAQKALEDAIAAGDKQLAGKISALDAALATAQAVLGAADDELSGRIDEATNTLQTAIDAVQKSLDETKAALSDADAALKKADADNKAALEATDAALAEKDEKLNTMSVVAIVLGSVGLLGNAGLITWIILDKKGILAKLLKK